MVINTPSLTSENDLAFNTKTEIARSLELATPGPHVFLIILEFNADLPPSEEDDKQLIESLIKIFGPGVFEYIVFVFTNLKNIIDKRIAVNQYMNNYLSQTFIDFMEKCKNRFIPIDDRAPPNAKDASFAALMLTIERMLDDNGRKVYTYRSPWQKQTAKVSMEA